ncbi:MAG: hypothetical protein ACYDDO_06320 [Acidiferrobacterales bacterium]
MTDGHRQSELEERIKRLEEGLATLRLGLTGAPQMLPPGSPALVLHPVWPLALGILGLGCGLLGVGLPQHYYQPMFAFLFLLLAYHRQACQFSPGHWRWPLAALNFLLLCELFKLLLGGGMQHPFGWFKVPTMTSLPPAGNEPWYQHLLPGFQLSWQGVSGVSDWFINLTRIQALLVIATLVGALFRFQPFASLTALALLVLSIPSFLNFNWDWVILFLVLGGSALYLQSPPASYRAGGSY